MRPDLIAANALITWDGSTDPEQLQYGQLLPGEGRALRRRARAVPAGLVIVELGSYTGKSTCCLARGSAEGNKVPVFAVDLWTAGTSRKGLNFRVRKPDEKGGSSKFHWPEVREVFDRRMKWLDTASVVQPTMGASVDVAADFDQPIGLLFIDAEHSYDACHADFDAWARWVVPGGVVALHDYAGKPEGTGGVKQYVDEMLRTDTRWSIVQTVGSMVVLQG